MPTMNLTAQDIPYLIAGGALLFAIVVIACFGVVFR